MSLDSFSSILVSASLSCLWDSSRAPTLYARSRLPYLSSIRATRSSSLENLADISLITFSAIYKANVSNAPITVPRMSPSSGGSGVMPKSLRKSMTMRKSGPS